MRNYYSMNPFIHEKSVLFKYRLNAEGILDPRVQVTTGLGFFSAFNSLDDFDD